MKTFLKNFVRDESGASAAEYALILAVVSLAIATSAAYLAYTISESMNEAASTIETPPTYDPGS